MLTPPRITAGTLLHLEHDEVGEATLLEAPGGAETGDATAHDDDQAPYAPAFWAWGDRRSQSMTPTSPIVDDPAGGAAPALA
jgi:hypothetical protein